MEICLTDSKIVTALSGARAVRRGVVALILLTACNIDRGAAVRDSAGVRIVSNAAALAAPTSLVSVGEEPALVIGGAGSPEQQFFQVSGLFTLSDGSMAVANSGTLEVRVFDSTGKFLRSMGRAGKGPGEFQSLYGIFRMPADSIAAFDTQSQSMTIFDPAGKLARTFTLSGSSASSRVVPVGMLRDGSDAAWLMISSQNVSTIDAGLARLDLFLARYDREGALRDTLLVVPGFELFVHNTSKGRVVPSVLFGRGAAVTTTHEGFAVAVNDRYQIDRYDGSARLRYSVRHRAEPRAISAADMDSARAAQELLFRVPDQRPLLREAYAQMPVATTMPAIGSTLPGRYPWIVNGAAGALWVLNYQSPVEKSATWSIFDEAGVLHGTLALPNGFILHEVGVDYLLGVQRDSLDTERIVKYRLLSR